MVGMIANDMAFFYHPFYQFRTGFQIISHYKKGSVNAMFL